MAPIGPSKSLDTNAQLLGSLRLPKISAFNKPLSVAKKTVLFIISSPFIDSITNGKFR